MKKLLIAAIALALGATMNAAEAPKSSYSVTLDFPYTSKYIFRGVELAKDSIQPSVEVTYSDFYAGVWTNQPVTKNIDNEFDFYVGYKVKLNDKWNVDVGTTAYYYPELNSSTGGKRTTYESYVGINGDVKGFTPGVYVYHDLTLDTTTAQFQLGYSVPIQDTGVTVDFTGNYGRVFVQHGRNYNYWSVAANVPFKLNDKATVYGGITYTNSDIPNAQGDFVTFNAGISIGF